MAWSYTALTSFETCPRKHYHTRIAKDVPDPPGAEAQWGTRVHKYLEDRIKLGTPLPESTRQYEPYAQRIANTRGDVITERKVAVTKDLKPTDFFAEDVWCRGIFDLTIVREDHVIILDWKTGKRRPGSDQLDLFAALARQLHPEASRITTGFVWLKAQKIDKETWRPCDLDDVWAGFVRRATRLEQAVETNSFDPKPNGLCRRYCPVRSCLYHGE